MFNPKKIVHISINRDPWQEAIEKALDRCTNPVIFKGPSWTSLHQNEEICAIIDQRVFESNFWVFLVLLMSAMEKKKSKTLFHNCDNLSEFPKFFNDEEDIFRLIASIWKIEPCPGCNLIIIICINTGIQSEDCRTI